MNRSRSRQEDGAGTNAASGPSARAVTVAPGYRILGVDPGTRILGYGIVELDRRFAPRVLGHGVCRLPAGAPLAERLRLIFLALQEFVAQTSPDVVVVEQVFYGRNFQSALRIGESRGVVLAVAALAGRDVVEYAPASVKRVVCGNGRASKLQVARMMERVLELDRPPETNDATDALALAYCHAQRIRRAPLTGGGGTAGKRTRRGAKGLTQKSLGDLLARIERGGRR